MFSHAVHRLAFFAVISDVLGNPSQPGRDTCHGGTCTTEACKTSANTLLGSLNQHMDPCDDFYEYACGGWIKANPIPDNEPFNSQFWNLSETTKLKVQQLIQTAILPTFKSEERVQQIYRQCQDRDETEKAGGTPILQLLDEQIGGWPVLSPYWNPQNFDLMKALETLRAYNDEPLFAFVVRKDQETPTENVIFFGEPSLFTSSDVLQKGSRKLYLDSYDWYVRNVTSLLIEDSGRRTQDMSDVNRDLKEIIALESFLILAEETALDRHNFSLTKNKTTLGGFRQTIFHSSSVARNLTGYVRSVFAVAGLGDEISDTTKIVVKSPQYFEQLDAKLVELERLGDEGKRRLANFIGWQLINSYDSYLSKKYRIANAEYKRRVLAQPKSKVTPHNEKCAKILIEAMPLAIGAMYVNRVVPLHFKEKAEMMADDIKAGFGELLDNAIWMDTATYQTALKKLYAIQNTVGYPDLLTRNLSAIDKQYENMTLRDTFFKTFHAACKANNIINLSRLKQKNMRGDPLYMSPDVTDINASYDPFSNFIYVLAGILQSPFYDSNNPQYLNYGSIGSVIGHEITHGFDNQGSLFDDQGNMRAWWTDPTQEKYDQRSQGMVLQYNNYANSAGNVNGKLTLGENIADNGGIKAAYRGYLRYRNRGACLDRVLPGLERFTFDQLFFIAAGQAWCSSTRPEVLQLYLLIDSHSPDKFRVMGAMSNLPEFSTAFNCPTGSKMNPLKKQMVW